MALKNYRIGDTSLFGCRFTCKMNFPSVLSRRKKWQVECPRSGAGYSKLRWFEIICCQEIIWCRVKVNLIKPSEICTNLPFGSGLDRLNRGFSRDG